MWNTALSHTSSSPHLAVWVPRPLSVVFQRLASLLSIKRGELYSKTILFIRCQLGFALLRSAVRWLRGSRSTLTPDHCANTNIDLARSGVLLNYLLFSKTYLFFHAKKIGPPHFMHHYALLRTYEIRDPIATVQDKLRNLYTT